jgi:hypothetical protein
MELRVGPADVDVAGGSEESAEAENGPGDPKNDRIARPVPISFSSCSGGA